MIFEKNVEIKVRDGAVLRANVFRPEGDAPVPVLMTHGPYGKDAHFEDAFKPQWDELKRLYPGIDTDGSSGHYLRWEVADPERWIPLGYAIVVVDSRGAGESPGKLQVWSPQEVDDYHDCIEWAGTQSWCSGKVGLLGISYYAMNQWQVAATRPSHLAAICPWEGAADFYRDVSHHGGIFGNHFLQIWYPKQILSVQNGNGQSNYIDRDTGKMMTGRPLTPDELTVNRVDIIDQFRQHPFVDDWYEARTSKLSQIEVPVLSAGNWGGMGLHLRGNIYGFLGTGSQQKWLQMHGGTHWESFYLPQYVELQKRFFDRFLKGQENGWEEQPPLILEVRHPGEKFVTRYEHEWPLARTEWTAMYLDASSKGLSDSPRPQEAGSSYEAPGAGVEFVSEPFSMETEFTGPLSAALWVQTDAQDMDLFVTIRAYDPQGKEVLFRGATDPAVPIAQGWLRASHRKTIPELSSAGRPHHEHRMIEPVPSNEPFRVEVEIWPTCIVLPAGYRISVRIDAQDFEREGATGPRKGSGPFLHTDPTDRPLERFRGRNTILTGGRFDSHLMLPRIAATRKT
ncbi:MAG: CocE/NonD family hydrolase [Hydrogenophaga sp.]|uniref:CocE/NonD family hydrolase n=1 Tax=Hydrogenophaga sp. TaxID=1904254 RepID=UPI0025BF37EC|nr:CocE/NonD family hydrolase [Hydrogenophaga sp.]MBU7573267.1 CocE/NonD family hydrolase [Hydrogenophaga sp.]